MNSEALLDIERGHRYFSAACFNETWKWLDKPHRSGTDDEQMIACAYASLYHWMQRPDYSPREMSVAYWLMSRVFASTSDSPKALQYAKKCLEISESLTPFYRGYALEALARACRLLEDRDRAEAACAKATALLDEIENADERQLLATDLATLQATSPEAT